MHPLYLLLSFRRFSWLLLLLIMWKPTGAQQGYNVTNYSTKQGLPQNIIRGMAFDDMGYLWLATEGGLARFDGQHFRKYGDTDHPGLGNERFTHAVKCNDTTILFVDQLSGMYTLSHNSFKTLQAPDPRNPTLKKLNGFVTDPNMLVDNASIRMQIHRALHKKNPYMGLFPIDENYLFLIGDNIAFVNRKTGFPEWFIIGNFDGQKFVVLDKDLLYFDESGSLHRMNIHTRSFEPCIISTKTGQSWTMDMRDVMTYSEYPMKHVLLVSNEQLLEIRPSPDQNRYIIEVILDKLPERTRINAVTFGPHPDQIVVGTESRGLFVYRKQYFQTLVLEDQKSNTDNTYYAQALLDSNTLLTSKRGLIDLNNMRLKGDFQTTFEQFRLGKVDQGYLLFNLFVAHMSNTFLHRYDPQKPDVPPEPIKNIAFAHTITNIGPTTWVGTNRGIGYIAQDSIHWIYQRSFEQPYQIQSIEMTTDSTLWFCNAFQVYRLHLKTRILDSVPELTNAGARAISNIDDKVFIGTYGKGFYIHENNQLTHLGTGFNNELSHVHAFIRDSIGFVWIPTNQGLYKVASSAFSELQHKSNHDIYFSTYLEEDGILNTEFNGGCSPPFIHLPDGRLSLPTMEGLVLFRPNDIPNYFSKDSTQFYKLEVNGIAIPLHQPLNIPANSHTINVHLSTSWWTHPYNLQIQYKLEGLHDAFYPCQQGQTQLSFGRLSPGSYTLIVRKRTGIEDADFTYSRLPFSISKPWYATNSAMLLFLSSGLLMVWGLSTWKTRTVEARNRSLQQEIEKQTRNLRKTNQLLASNLDKLAQSEQNLRQNIRIRDRLISIITHDILTPLRFISMIARLGKSETTRKPQSSDSFKVLDEIQHATDKLYHSTQNLLNWVHFKKDDFRPASINCSPFAIVEQLAENFSEMCLFQGNQLVNNISEDDIIRTDAQILTIILHNLLSNAIKYTQHGRITVHSSTGDDVYTITVSDTGRGMSTAQMDAIRSGNNLPPDPSTDHISAGTGIGLSLVSEMVQALSASWHIEDHSPNKGISVHIKIPVIPSNS